MSPVVRFAFFRILEPFLKFLRDFFRDIFLRRIIWFSFVLLRG